MGAEEVARQQREIVRERRRVLAGEGGGTGCYFVLFKSQVSCLRGGG